MRIRGCKFRLGPGTYNVVVRGVGLAGLCLALAVVRHAIEPKGKAFLERPRRDVLDELLVARFLASAASP